MNNAEISVLLGGVVAIVAILYFFFGPKKEEKLAATTDGHQRVTVVVDGGFSPSEIKLKVGQPAEISFDRRDRGECTDWVVFDRFPTKENQEIKSFLPSGQVTTLKFTPTKTGTFHFACGMGMNRSKLVVIN